MAQVVDGYIGIDNGTQGLSVIFTDVDLNVLATGEGSYDFVPGLGDGCYEQRCEDWDNALRIAIRAMNDQLKEKKNITPNPLAIGISGQMHGEVLVDDKDQPLQPIRLWCDARNEEEGHELTELLGTKIPKRATAARFLWTCRNRPDIAASTAHLTTPAGWCTFRLTGQYNLGVGDAAGMFPINCETMDYDEEKLDSFDKLVGNKNIPSLKTLLPAVKLAGDTDTSSSLTTPQAATEFGIPAGIPVAAGEGDQVAALAGSLIGQAGWVSCSFGTSVCANIVGADRKAFQGVSPAVDHFCAADGKPIHMVWLRNGTTFLNTIVASYGGDFAKVMPEMLQAAPDCGGLLAQPFMDDEPGLQIAQGGTAMIVGLTQENATMGNIAKAALLSTTFNLKLGCGVLLEQGFPQKAIVLTGGLSKSPECGQILADVFDLPCTLLDSADEGCCWGVAVMAKYRHLKMTGKTDQSWNEFLTSLEEEKSKARFEPDPDSVLIYKSVFERYKRLVALHPCVSAAIQS